MKTKAEITENMLNELNFKIKALNLILLIFGIVGIVGYIVLAVIFDDNAYLNYLLYISSIFFGFGLVYSIMINKTIKKQLQNKQVDEYEFLEDCIVATSYKNNQKFAAVKYNYNEFVKVKETENFLFLYPNKFSALLVPKNQLTKEEFSLILSKVKNTKVWKLRYTKNWQILK